MPEDAGTSLLDKPALEEVAPADAKPNLDSNPEGSKDGKPAAQPNASPADKPTDDASKPKAEDAPKVPEKYEAPKAPEGLQLNASLLEDFDKTARDLHLTQEQRDSILAIQFKATETHVKETMDAFSKQIEEWAAETKKELGTEPDKALAVASKAIDRIFTNADENKAFRTMMTDTGLGNWKLMVKVFSYIGKAISEDTLVNGPTAVEKQKSIAERMFGESDKK